MATVHKKPPPEPPDQSRRRFYIILSFWAIVILLGLPIWRWTTSIYRAKLPLREMMDWADGKACRLVFPLQIYVQAPNLAEQERQHLIRLTQHALDDLNDFSVHHLRLQLSQAGTSRNSSAMTDISSLEEAVLESDLDSIGDTALTVTLFPGETGSTPKATLKADSPILEVHYAPNQVPPTSATSSILSTFLANQLQELFAEEQAMIAHVLSVLSASSVSSTGANNGQTSQTIQGAGSNGRETRVSPGKPLSANIAADTARRMTRSAKYAPTYHLTFSLFTPNAIPSSWDIEAALKDQLLPLLDSFSTISNFTIDTQVQLYARFSPSVREPEYDVEKGVWTLRKEDLSGFINAAEWPLSPSIGAAPTLNFILYVPSPDRTPLVVKDHLGSSWLIPQWGGVTILNPLSSSLSTPSPATHHLTSSVLQAPLSIFSQQLLALLGAPRTPSPSLPLRFLTLTRIRSASLLLSASSTLGSLARLTRALPSIPIPATVAANVDRTITHLTSACAALHDGRFHSALTHARLAESHAERGFFEKSMVGQVYFPDEHKVAVYLPLLGPVGVPLVIGAIKEGVRFWRDWRLKRVKAVA